MIVRHDWSMPKGFRNSNENGHEYDVFYHFRTPVNFKLCDETFDIDPGGCIFIESGVPHSFYSKELLSHNWIIIKNDRKHILYKYNIPLNQLIYLKDDLFISKLCLLMEMECFNANNNKDDLLDAYLNEFLIKFMRGIDENGNKNNTKNIDRNVYNKMRMARNQLISTPEHNWTVNELAAVVPISPSRFYALYKKFFQSTPTYDLIRARVEFASSLLLGSPELSIAEIAEKVGYNDQYHFIRQFKQIKKITPGKYRKTTPF